MQIQGAYKGFELVELLYVKGAVLRPILWRSGEHNIINFFELEKLSCVTV